MSELAILGGSPLITKPFRHYNSVGEKEIQSTIRVLRSGVLSKFVGAPGDDFYGGPMVRDLEEAWRSKIGAKHAVSVNSATSGLFAALGAIGIGPGDEVIVPPYTMSATVMAPLVYGGIPVFADVEPDTFCIDPAAVKAKITSRTKAIIAVNLFGQPAALAELRILADSHNIKLIEDNAQSPLAMEGDKYAGTVGDIGVFSLNYHKHIHTGEGGICVTNDSELCQRLQLIRNHGENLVESLGVSNLTNLIGYNYRMTELCAAVGIHQLEDAEVHIDRRTKVASYLSEAVEQLPGITPPKTRVNCKHVFYAWACRYDEEVVGVSREVFGKALAAEGFPHSRGYVKPLYLLPIFQKRIGIGREGYPFNLTQEAYVEGMCPVVEQLHNKELLEFHVCAFDLAADDLDLLSECFRKMFRNIDELRTLHSTHNLCNEENVVASSRSKH